VKVEGFFREVHKGSKVEGCPKNQKKTTKKEKMPSQKGGARPFGRVGQEPVERFLGK